MREKLKRLLPGYAVLPLIMMLIINFVAFYGSRVINCGRPLHDLALPLDARVPFYQPFIVVYILAFPFWALNFYLIARESPRHCGVIFGEQIAKMLCFICFMILPTGIECPKVVGNDVFSWLTRMIYAMDIPDNLFPSIHCLDSWLCWRGLRHCRRVGKGYKRFSLIFALLVFASTVLVKQHVLLDIPAAVLAGEIGLWLSARLRLGERYAACWERREAKQ